MTRIGLAFGLLASALAASPGLSEAGLVAYTFEGRATGTLGDASFADAAFSLVAVADTADIYDPLPFPGLDVLAVPALSTTLSVGGIGTATVDVGVIVFANRVTDVVGLFGDGIGDFLDLAGPAFAGYDLLAPFATPPGAQVDPLVSLPVPTSRGLLQFDPLSRPTGLSFRAIAVPEPASLAMCGMAAAIGLGVAGARRRAA